MDYLFVGQDSLSKDIKLEKIKQEILPQGVGHFDFDYLYGKDLDLLKLQEVLLRLPLKAKKRLILIRQADKLKENIKEYLMQYFKEPLAHVSLILDVEKIDKKDSFFHQLSNYIKVFRFAEREVFNTFKLAEEIDKRSINSGLKILNLLLVNGEKPERIMAGLRYHWQKSYLPPQERERRLKLLLNCDIDIKTGKVRPAFALERLAVSLCCSLPIPSQMLARFV